MTRPLLLTLCCLFAGLQPILAQQPPASIAYQGLLTDNTGTPIDGTKDLTLRLFDALSGGTQVWSRAYTNVTIDEGLYALMLEAGTPALETIAFDRPLWLEVEVTTDGATLAPRTALAMVPYAQSLRNMRVTPETSAEGPNVIGGWSGNTVGVGVVGATIAGGGFPNVLGIPRPNEVSDNYGTVGGGRGNSAGFQATVGGGFRNIAAGQYATVGGGLGNSAARNYATVPGGFDNSAAGDYSFAAGHDAKANHEGTFVWNDRSVTTGNDSLVSTAPNQFLIRAAGGVGIGTNAPQGVIANAQLAVADGHVVVSNNFGFFSYNETTDGIGAGIDTTPGDALQLYAGGQDRITVQSNGKVGLGTAAPAHPFQVGEALSGTGGNGAHVTDGGTWTSTSSRQVKEAFRPVDVEAVLEKVAALPVLRWHYKGSDEGEHLGPMAEDFYAAFGLGHTDRAITMVDADGVALAAIQALYRKNQALALRNGQLETRMSAQEKLLNNLLARLEALEARP